MMDKGIIVRTCFESGALKNNPLNDPHVRDVPVYLPPGYDSQSRFPVIWVLAPYTSWGERYLNLQAWDENIIQRMDRLIMQGVAKPAIMVMPDCFTALGGSQYLNSSAVGNYQSYIINELVPYIDSTYSTLPSREHRAVMGYSSGGYGALLLSMLYPDIFSAAACHAGDMGFDTCYRPDIPAAIRGIENAGSVRNFLSELTSMARPQEKNRDWFSTLGMIAMSACYSPSPEEQLGFRLPFDLHTGELDEEVWQQWISHDPVVLAENHIETLKSLKALYFDCGIRDEFNLFLGARRLHNLLVRNEVAHTYEEFDGGHMNINWRYDISLPIISNSIQA